MNLIEKHVDGNIGTLTFNHDEQRNKLSEVLVQQLASALDEFRDIGVRAAILRAHPGVKVWSAGHSVEELPQGGHDPLCWRDSLRMLIRDIGGFPAPLIALIEGSVWGGACEVAFACDMVVATPEVQFSMTPAKIGVPYNATGLQTFLNTTPLHVAKEMLFTGRAVPVERLERIGVVNHIVAAEEITAFTEQMARDIALNAPLSIAVMKEQLRILAGAQALSPFDFERIQGLRRVVYNSDDYLEGISAFREKRKPKYRGR